MKGNPLISEIFYRYKFFHRNHKRKIMKRLLAILFLIYVAGFYSCSSGNKKSNSDTPSPFNEFIGKFKPLHLPLTFRMGLGAKNFDYNLPVESIPNVNELKNLPEFDKNSVDTLFIKEYGDRSIFYGMLPDTSNYIGLILILNGVEGSPLMLLTFDKSGNSLGREYLYCNDCRANIELEWCSSTATIGSDLSINSVDSIKTVKRDEEMNIADSTGSFYIVSKNGIIDESGKISMSDISKTDIH